MVSNPRYPLVCVLKDHGPDFNLLPFLEGLEYEETGNDELSNALITLNAHFGKFIKPVTQTGTVIPKIEFFDRIYIEFTDPAGNITKDVVEVVAKFPSEMSGVGDTIELHCEHQGWYFFRGHNLKQYQRESNFDMVKDQGDVYNSPEFIPTKHPVMVFHDVDWNPLLEVGNAASKATSIDMDFGNSEFLMGEGVNAIADRAGASVDAGGELEFFDWRTVSGYDHNSGTLLDQIRMQYRISGDVLSKVTISKSDPVIKILDTRSSQEPEKSTNIMGYGDLNSGSLLPGFQIYFGEKEEFLAAKLWVDARVYKQDMRVSFEGAFYKALQDHTAQDGVNDPTTGLGVFWTGPEAFAPSVFYSQLTKDRPQYWINSGAGYIHSTTFPANNKAACHDHNLVIRDRFHRRTWVDVREVGVSSIPSSMYLQGGGDEMYRGFRMLLDTENGLLPLLQPFNLNGGVDQFGIAYADAVVQHNGGTFTGSEEFKNWDVFLTPVDDLEVIVMRDGESLVYNPCDSLTFNNVCTGSRTAGWNIGAYQAVQLGGLSLGTFLPGAIADCLHPYNILDGPPRPDFGSDQGIEPGTPGINSAVRVKYEASSGVRSLGAWLNLAFPIPRDGFAGAFTATTVGEKYLNPTLDFNNKHLSSLAQRGLNQGLDSEGRGTLDYGKINAFRTYTKLIALAALNIIPPGGDFKIRVSFLDTGDNNIVKDLTLTHRDNFDELEATLPGEIYRGRHGIAFTPVSELEILDIFETRNVVRISISTLDSYDNEGRYNPLNRFAALFGSFELQNDGTHFVKPLSATTQEETVQANKPERNLERDPLNAPQISNYRQLRNHVLSTLEVEQFKRVEFEITRNLSCDIKFGQEFTLDHPILVDDPDIAPNNKIDLVCKKNIFNYKKGKGGGGFTVKTIGVKRFRT